MKKNCIKPFISIVAVTAEQSLLTPVSQTKIEGIITDKNETIQNISWGGSSDNDTEEKDNNQNLWVD